MIQLIRVTGESLSPFFLSGDYVIILRYPSFLIKLRVGDWVVFQHPVYGLMIKTLESVDQAGKELMVVGFHPESTDSRKFGAIPQRWVTGKVILHIRKPNRLIRN